MNEEAMTLGVTFYSGDTVTLTQIAHGHKPQILITPVMQEDGDIHIELDVTGPESKEDLIDFLEAVTLMLKEGEES